VLRFAIERASSRAVWAVSITSIVLTIVVGGCAAIQASKHEPGTIKNGSFVPGRPASAQYGPDASQTCPPSGAIDVIGPDLESAAKKNGTPVPKPDPRLCSAADTLLGWENKELPGESVSSFLAWYFGLPSPNLRVTIGPVGSEDVKVVAVAGLDPISAFAKTAVRPAFGLATTRLRKDTTKVVIVMQDLAVDIDPVPKRLAPNSQATLSGKLVGNYQNPKIMISNPAGQFETPSIAPGKTFQAELRCADRPGRIQVQIQAESKESQDIVASFPVACGTDQPTSVAVAAPGPGKPLDIPSEEKKLLAMINAERSAAGLVAVAWDDAVANVARSISENNRDSQKGGGQAQINVAERMKQADVASPLILTNPALARSAEDAHARFSASSSHRANYMNSSITNGGVGIASSTDASGHPIYFVTELFVQELPPVDPQAIREKLRIAIAQRRSDARAGPLASDRALDDAAQQSAKALADAKGNLPKARQDELISPLRKSFKSINILGGAKSDPLEFAEEPGIIASAKLLGIGVAQGTHPALGKNAIYVVVLTGTRR